MCLGVIADDLTGATDIAGFLAGNGLDTIQLMGMPDPALRIEAQAAVVSLKTRSIPSGQATGQSLDALRWLQNNGCRQVYFKYCSTFDSTREGNIGPVTDALMDALNADLTVICPSLPVNGRVVRDGVLLVNGVPLAETGMRHHPVNPMTESDLVRLMEMQSRGKAAVVDHTVVEKGVAAVRRELDSLRGRSVRYAVLDAETDTHLDTLARAVDDMPLLTGGSGLGAARARLLATADGENKSNAPCTAIPKGRPVILAGSCSEMTNRQVARYKENHAALKVDAGRSVEHPAGYVHDLANWVMDHAGGPAPLVYATADKEELAEIQQRYGPERASQAIESVFAELALELVQRGIDRFIVAGGETSGAVTLALGAKAFRIGPEIAPGVPWIRSLERPLYLALKSGNFGDEQFFFKAQEMLG